MKRTIYIHPKKKDENLEDNDFAKTGVSSFSLKLNLKVTQKDMEKDLIQRTEGNFIKPEHFDGNEN